MGKVKISPSLVFLLCILIYYGWEDEVGCFLLAALLHELGHLAAIRLCGCEFIGIRFGLGGACIQTGTMTYTQEFFCAAAGPFVNLLCMLFPARLFFFCNLFLLLFNLLPMEPLDGEKMLGAFCGSFFPLYRQLVCDIAAVCSAAVLLLGGIAGVRLLPYGQKPMAFAVGLLIRTCFFRVKTVQ